ATSRVACRLQKKHTRKLRARVARVQSEARANGQTVVVAATKGARRAPCMLTRSRVWSLLDLRLAELDVFLGDRIVFLLDQLVGHGARVLARHVIEAGVGARHELDFDGGGLRHGGTSGCVSWPET